MNVTNTSTFIDRVANYFEPFNRRPTIVARLWAFFNNNNHSRRPVIGLSTPDRLLSIPAATKVPSVSKGKRLSISEASIKHTTCTSINIYICIYIYISTSISTCQKKKRARSFVVANTQRWLNNSLHPALYYCNTSKWFLCYAMSYTTTIMNKITSSFSASISTPRALPLCVLCLAHVPLLIRRQEGPHQPP